MTWQPRKIADLDAEREARIADDHGYLAELLGEHVPSFSPGAAIWMMDKHLPAIQTILDLPGLPDAEREMLQNYVAAVDLIMRVAAHHQSIVIARLHRCIRTDLANELNLEHPDHLETAQALLKLANLGRDPQ